VTACALPRPHRPPRSPLEVSQGAATLGWPLHRYLAALRDAGLGSLPGTAAEVLHDDVRAVLCPDKLSTHGWLEVVEAAHSGGCRGRGGRGGMPGAMPGLTHGAGSLPGPVC
jgi:FO synthase